MKYILYTLPNKHIISDVEVHELAACWVSGQAVYGRSANFGIVTILAIICNHLGKSVTICFKQN